MNNHSNIALLIDADNTPVAKLDHILSNYDSIAVKRAYGNWSKPCLKNWEPVLQRHGIRAVQQFDCTPGKNATDIALTVDAMDLLHSGRYDTFILVASDSDYTPLALRLRESGAEVIGIGKAGAPAAYVTACNAFRTLEGFTAPADDLNTPIDVSFLFDDDDELLENAPGDAVEFASEEEILHMDIDDFPTLKIAPELVSEDTEPAEAGAISDDLWDTLEDAADSDDDDFSFPPVFGLDENGELLLQDLSGNVEPEELIWDSLDDLLPSVTSGDSPEMRSVHKLLHVAYDCCKGEDGFALLSSIGNFIKELRPDFDYHDYGFCQLHELLQAYPEKYQLITVPRHTRAKVMAFRCCA